MHAERVVLFFHGNSGTRACPPKRVALIKLLAAQLHAHVVTFDYSGFGDSGGRPSEAALYADARDMYEWVRKRTSNEADIVVYGQSLGTFAAVDLMAHLSRVDDLPKGLILDAPPTSLIDAAMTHPVTLPFRIIPFVKRFMTWVLHDKLDSVEKIGEIRAPILILHGQEDAMIGVEQGRRLAEAARAAGCDITFVEFENCGHMDICGEETYLGNVHLFLGQILRRPIPQIS